MATNTTDLKDWAKRSKDRDVKKGAGPTGAGEGSRGGKVIGHTKSGVAIYASGGYTNAQQLVHHVEQAHGNMTAAEHGEAAGVHREAAKGEEKGSPGKAIHEAHARAHELVGANKGLAQHFGGSAAPGLAHGMDHSGAAPAGHTGTSPTDSMQARHAGIKSGDAAHAVTKAVAAKGSSATPADHQAASAAHAQASEANARIGAMGASGHHAELAGAHKAAASGDHAGAAKAFGKAAHNSEHAEAFNAIAKDQAAKASGGGSAAHAAPPEQHPMSKVRAKLEKSKGAAPAPALDFTGHRSAGEEHKASQAAEAAGKPKSAARHAGEAADRVTKGLAVGDVSQKGHETAAALHTRAAGLAKKAGRPDDVAYHQKFAAAHTLGAKAEASGKESDHDAAASAFTKAENPRIASHHTHQAEAASAGEPSRPVGPGRSH